MRGGAEPFFSVIIPTYNRRALLSEVLGSVRVQRFRDFEIIVIDDGSTDGTPDFLLPRQRRPVAAVDALDVSHGDRLGAERELFSGGNVYFRTGESPAALERPLQVTIRDCFFGLLAEQDVPVPTQSVAVRREAFQHVGGFSDSYIGEDVDLWLRLGHEPGFA